MNRLRGFVDLAFHAVEQTTNLIERTHDATAKRSVRRFAPIEPLATPANAVNSVQQGIASGVYWTIRTVNRAVHSAVGSGIDLLSSAAIASAEDGAFELATPLRSTSAGSLEWVVDYAQSAVTGLHGDWLSKNGNPLASTMHLRHEGRRLSIDEGAFRAAFGTPTNKLAVFVHGLSSTEWMWTFRAEDYYGDPSACFGNRLRDDHGYTPIYVRYNTGLHISENGRLLSNLLAEVLEAYPVEVDAIVLIGHSMGGLVSRSAAHYGDVHEQPWTSKLRHIVSLGAPHLGAPLEKAVNLTAGALRFFETTATQVISELLNSRSAGIKDLRFGYTTDEEWLDQDPDAVLHDRRADARLLDHVGYYFVGATISRDPAHPLGHLVGDLLVRLPSAAGHHPEPVRRIPFHSGKILGGLSHVQLANHPTVYEALQQWIQ